VAHPPIRDRLVAIANANANDPDGFLEDLSDVHDDWHSEFTRTYGFLLFHHRVVRYFQAIVNARLETEIAPYAADDLQDMSIQPFGADIGGVDNLAELAALSLATESWHNITHDRLATATGTPLLDARRNIFFRPFWQLHLYIDRLFVQALDQYGDRAHTGQFVTPTAVASHIEVSHHGWVRGSDGTDVSGPR
jgi:hypothetical protein